MTRLLDTSCENPQQRERLEVDVPKGVLNRGRPTLFLSHCGHFAILSANFERIWGNAVRRHRDKLTNKQTSSSSSSQQNYILVRIFVRVLLLLSKMSERRIEYRGPVVQYTPRRFQPNSVPLLLD